MQSSDRAIRDYHLQARRRRVRIHLIAAGVLALSGIACLMITFAASSGGSRYEYRALFASIGVLVGAAINIVLARRTRMGIDDEVSSSSLPPMP